MGESGTCKKCRKHAEELVDGLCAECFFSAETIMDSIMDDIGVPKLMEISRRLKQLLSGKGKVSVKKIGEVLLMYDDIDWGLISDLVADLPMTPQNKEIVLREVKKEYDRRRPPVS